MGTSRGLHAHHTVVQAPLLSAARQPQPSPQDVVFHGNVDHASRLPSGFPSHLPRNPVSLNNPEAPDCPLLPVLPSLSSLRCPPLLPPDSLRQLFSLPLSACLKCHLIGRASLTPTVKNSGPIPFLLPSFIALNGTSRCLTQQCIFVYLSVFCLALRDVRPPRGRGPHYLLSPDSTQHRQGPE